MPEESKEPEALLEEDVTNCVVNLTGALANLLTIDAEDLSVRRKAKLARMKRLIFDSIAFHCELLPQDTTEDKKED